MSTLKPNSVTEKCYHCGERCEHEAIRFDQKDFCCQGCKLVYEVLSENDLCAYYDIESFPGESQKSKNTKSNRFDYLSDPDVEQKLLDFKNGEESHYTFYVPLIHCASCIWLLENLNQIHGGIIGSRVDFVKKKVQVRISNQKISLQELVNLLSNLGYEPKISLSDLDGKQKPKADRKTLNRLAVAGFCFGNMMLFSLPEYFSERELLGEGFRGLFNYLNVLLSLPIVFYAANDYYLSAWNSLKQKQINMDVPIVLGILALFLYSLWQIFIHGEAGYMDSLGGLLFFLLLGKIYQQKTFATLEFERDYKSYFPVSVTRLVKDAEEVVLLTKVKLGDMLAVRDEELVPADCILLSDHAYIDYSFVTGEEVPVKIKKGEVIYAGGRQRGERILLTVQKAPSQGYLTDLWNNETFARKKESGLIPLSNRISAVFTWAVLGIGFSALIFWSMTDVATGIKAFTSVLIVACPCALAMSTPFTLGNTLRIFGRNKFYLKNAGVIERLAQVNTIVFDKTGTLTDTTNANITFTGQELNEQSKAVIKALVESSTHPLSNRINQWLGQVQPVALKDLEEIKGSGLRAEFLGQEVRLGSTSFTGTAIPTMTTGGNIVCFTVEGQQIGYFTILSGLRNAAKQVVGELATKQELHLLSGDNSHEYAALAGELTGMNHYQFNQSPKDKLAYLERLNGTGAKTMMIGDGLNDAGALQESTVGVAITDQVSHFSPASDAILDTDAFRHIPAFLEFSQSTRNVIKASFGLSIAYNVVGISFAVQGLLSPVFCAILMPLSSISVVLFTTVSTNILAYKRGLISLRKK
ncbi:heavy metal translocating P-type ATPase [Algoriphagus namhaensis]